MWLLILRAVIHDIYWVRHDDSDRVEVVPVDNIDIPLQFSSRL